MTHENLIVLHRAKDLFIAQELHDALEDAGIAARVEGEFLATALGDIPCGITTAPRVLIHAEDEPRARAILDALLQRHSQSQSHGDTDPTCLACGTAMNDVEICPECGWSYQIDAAEP